MEFGDCDSNKMMLTGTFHMTNLVEHNSISVMMIFDKGYPILKSGGRGRNDHAKPSKSEFVGYTPKYIEFHYLWPTLKFHTRFNSATASTLKLRFQN